MTTYVTAANLDQKPLRVGVIGCGRIAQVAHLPAIAKAREIELVAVSDPSATLSGGVGRRYEVPGFTDTEKLLATDIEAVLIAVPDRFHLNLARLAFAAGKHVLVEKPIALTSAEARELAEAAQAHDRLLQVGAMRRHDPGIRLAREAVAGLGQVLSASFWYRLPTALRVSTEATLFPALVVDENVRTTEASFKADREQYLLRTHGAHVFDTVRYLLGDVSSVRAELTRTGPDLNWQGSMRTSAGLAAFAITANTHSDYAEGAEIFGEHGQVSVRSYFPFFRRASSTSVFSEEAGAWTAREFGAVDPYYEQLRAFAAAVRGTGKPDPDGWDGKAAVDLIEAAAASVAAGGELVAL